ncbi:recombinase family protein, partial [Rufibacter latericius]
MKNKVALLARVSTRTQSTDRQISELTEYATSQGWETVQTFEEVISGTKQNEDRPILQEVLKLAEEKKINKLVVHEVSRLGRKTLQVLKTLEVLHAHKVSVVIRNHGIETLTPEGKVNPVANLILTILADLADMERGLLVERIHSGLEEAKRKGKKLGRKEGTTKDLLKQHPKVIKYLKAGHSIAET